MRGGEKPRLVARALRGAVIVRVGLLLLGCRGAEASTNVTDTALSASSSSAFPKTARDFLGRTVTLDHEPKRIVALLPSHAEMLHDLGVSDRIVGIDDYTDYPPSVTTLPRLGNLFEARLESLVAMKPNLILASDSSPTVAAMAQAGLTVWAGSAQTLDDVCRTERALGALVERDAEANQVCERIRSEMLEAERAALALPRRDRVYFELDATPYAVGSTSFVGALLASAGGDNVVPAGLGDFPKVSPELIAHADPEVIIGARLEDVAHRPGWSAIAAVRSKRVYTLTPEERSVVVRPGSRMGQGIRVLSRLIHTEAP